MFNSRRWYSPDNWDGKNPRQAFLKVVGVVLVSVLAILTYFYGITVGVLAVIGIICIILYPSVKRLWFSIGRPSYRDFYKSESVKGYRIYMTFRRFIFDTAKDTWTTEPFFLPMLSVTRKGYGFYDVRVENFTVGPTVASKDAVNLMKGALPNGLTIISATLEADGNNYLFKVMDTDFDRRLEIGPTLIDSPAGVIPLSKNREWNYLKQPHAVLSGSTGSGKSYLITYLYLSLLKDGANVTLIDPKKSELSNLKGEVSTLQEDLLEIEDVASRMQEKERQPYEERAVDVLVIDELASLKLGIEKAEVTRLDRAIKEICLMGRSSKTFLILVAQQANAQNIPTEIREQLSLRVMLGPAKKSALDFLFPGYTGEYSGGNGEGLLGLSSKEEPFTAPSLKEGLDFETLKKNIQKR